jgi:hypothetical protein
MHVGQHARRGAARSIQPARFEIGVGRVRRAAQRVDDPARRAPEERPGLGLDLGDVRQVGEIADAEAERVDCAVFTSKGAG